MRFVFVFAFAFVLAANAGTLPLTAKEVSLMLRSGYTVPAVESELSTRHFGDTLDEAKRKQLINAGASAELLDEIERGKFKAPKEEIEKAKKVEEAAERAMAVRANAPPKPAAGTKVSSAADVIAQAIRGNLVQNRNGFLVPYNDEDLNRKKIYGLYFSAHWCPPCRKFTPKLVEWYKQTSPSHPEFEVIFFSNDKSPEAMAEYVRSAGMPWPAIDYPKIPMLTSLLRYGGDGIPDLVIVDGSGQVLADSYQSGKYVGPSSVLQTLDNLFASGAVAWR